ncbi:hypothetical protein LZ30DRAFT_686049 [Colletotrichum cereale]|nr:hypothetical protein LZ30DRAFT_686049 [Colletotrichum cereale]
MALLRLDANIATTDVAEETALERAASAGHPDVVIALLNDGPSANTATDTVGWTLLIGNIETVRLLVEAGANITADTKWRDSALSLGTLKGHEYIANLLADAGAILKSNKVGRRASVQANRIGLEAIFNRPTTLNDPEYSAIADVGLQREGKVFGNELAMVAELKEETLACSCQPANEGSQAPTAEDLVYLDVDLEDIPYKRGFLRRYDLMGKLGKGHYSEVWLCNSKIARLHYAVKIISFQTEEEEKCDRRKVEWAHEQRLSHCRNCGIRAL